MITKFGISISFKTAIIRLMNKYPKMKNCSLSLYFLKKYMRAIKEIRKENATNFK